MCVYVHTFCCVIQAIASWKLLPDSSQAPELPLVLLLLCMVPVNAMWTPFSWSLHISNLTIKKRERKDIRTRIYITARIETTGRNLPYVLTMLSFGCPSCLKSTAQLFSCSIVSFAIAM